MHFFFCGSIWKQSLANLFINTSFLWILALSFWCVCNVWLGPIMSPNSLLQVGTNNSPHFKIVLYLLLKPSIFFVIFSKWNGQLKLLVLHSVELHQFVKTSSHMWNVRQRSLWFDELCFVVFGMAHLEEWGKLMSCHQGGSKQSNIR